MRGLCAWFQWLVSSVSSVQSAETLWGPLLAEIAVLFSVVFFGSTEVSSCALGSKISKRLRLCDVASAKTQETARPAWRMWRISNSPDN
jgi:hypothetical protein